MKEADTIKLSKALEDNEVPGRTDIWSGLGRVWLSSVDAWYPARPELLLSRGKTYKFEDRFGNQITFVA